MSKDIMSMTYGELAEVFSGKGLPGFRAKQVYQWLHCRLAASYDEMTDLPKALREQLAEEYPLNICTVAKKQVSAADGTVKFLYALHDGDYIESVVMKYKYGYTLCISSQVGCKMGCVFCASTKSGCVRSLYPSEMIGQIHAAQRDMNIRVSHVVMMGMGEPLDNFDNAMRFLELVGDDKGLNLSLRNISLSTCGVVPRIYDLMDRHLQLTLSVSLHAPNNEMRSKTMPINRKYPIEELLKACREYTKRTSRRISFEYAMIKDVNDSDACAYELASLLKGMLCHVNLIPANEIVESSHKRSTNERLERFIQILNSRGINATVRRSLGSDIDASCGQLRSRHNREISEKEGNK